MREYHFYVYILANRSRNTYVGVTNNLFMRVMEHRAGKVGSYTARYRITRLVYVEKFKYVRDAIAREKELKDWNRARKLELIEGDNPAWEDLAEGWGAVGERLRRLALGLDVPLLEAVREVRAFGEADPSASLRDDRVQKGDDRVRGVGDDRDQGEADPFASLRDDRVPRVGDGRGDGEDVGRMKGLSSSHRIARGIVEG